MVHELFYHLLYVNWEVQLIKPVDYDTCVLCLKFVIFILKAGQGSETSGTSNRLMQPEQLAEISKLLNQVKGQYGGGQTQATTANTEEEHMLQIFSLLKYMQRLVFI